MHILGKKRERLKLDWKNSDPLEKFTHGNLMTHFLCISLIPSSDGVRTGAEELMQWKHNHMNEWRFIALNKLKERKRREAGELEANDDGEMNGIFECIFTQKKNSTQVNDLLEARLLVGFFSCVLWNMKNELIAQAARLRARLIEN